eukprot:8779960-Ditylum_brightwellii.AAC.1
MATARTFTWQGTYCYGIIGDIIHRQPATMDKDTATLEKWEQEIIDNVEILVSLDKLIASMQQGKCSIAIVMTGCPAFGKDSSLRAE